MANNRPRIISPTLDDHARRSVVVASAEESCHIYIREGGADERCILGLLIWQDSDEVELRRILCGTVG